MNNKKNFRAINILLTLLVLNTGLYAQSHKKGQFDLNLGVGIGNNVIENGHSAEIPPLSVSGEYGITNDVSIGGYLGFTGATYRYSGWDNCYGVYGYTDSYRWTYFVTGVRGSYHFGRFIKVDKLDLYAGLMLGYDFANYSYSTTSMCPDHIRYVSPTYGGPAYSIYSGARYRFTNHFGVFGEIGYGISILNIGFNFKL